MYIELDRASKNAISFIELFGRNEIMRMRRTKMISVFLSFILLFVFVTSSISYAKTYKEGKTAWFKGTVKHVKNDQENAVGDKVYVLVLPNKITISAFGQKYKVKKLVLSAFYEDEYAEFKNKKVKVKAKLVAGDAGFVLQPKIKTMVEI